jgi:hypothetical protein
MSELTQEQIERFVIQIITIERKYGYELRNVATSRQEEIGKWLNKFITEEFADDNKQNNA